MPFILVFVPLVFHLIACGIFTASIAEACQGRACIMLGDLVAPAMLSECVRAARCLNALDVRLIVLEGVAHKQWHSVRFRFNACALVACLLSHVFSLRSFWFKLLISRS
jgi:hypothetical protein